MLGAHILGYMGMIMGVYRSHMVASSLGVGLESVREFADLSFFWGSCAERASRFF